MMASQELVKLVVPLAPVLARLDLAADERAQLQMLPTAAAALEVLHVRGLSREAVQLVAQALPVREAVWWACMCAASVADAALSPADAKAAAAAEHWVRHAGDEAARRRAGDAAQAGALRSPQAWAAMAAFWSGGSMAPAGQPVVPPAPRLAGDAVAGAVLLAAVQGRPEWAPQRLDRFLAAARDIAAGGAGRLAPEPAT